MEGRERITLGSNNYLGLTTHPRGEAGAPRTRSSTTAPGLTGSRFMNGTTPLHLELERELADWTGAEDALVFTTGYQANVGCIATLLDAGDTVICDSGDHASILDAVMMSRARIRPFRHNKLDKLEKMLERVRTTTAAACSWWWTACSRWRATWPRCPTSWRCAASTARGCWWTRPTASACWARPAPAPARRSAWPTRSTCGWAPSRSRWPPAAASSPGPPR